VLRTRAPGGVGSSTIGAQLGLRAVGPWWLRLTLMACAIMLYLRVRCLRQGQSKGPSSSENPYPTVRLQAHADQLGGILSPPATVCVSEANLSRAQGAVYPT
jgi:hypothetical protein